MWTAEVTQIDETDFGLRVVVVYKDDTDKIERDYYLSGSDTSDENLKSIVKNEIDSLTQKDEQKASIVIGSIDVATNNSPQSEEEIKRQSLKVKEIDLENKLHLVDMGIITETEGDIPNLRKDIHDLLVDLNEI